MMGAMKLTLVAAAVWLLTQDPAPKKAEGPIDVLYLQDRTEVRGEILQYSASGRIKVKPAG